MCIVMLQDRDVANSTPQRHLATELFLQGTSTNAPRQKFRKCYINVKSKEEIENGCWEDGDAVNSSRKRRAQLAGEDYFILK